MTNHRLQPWNNILDDLGPDDGHVLPWWLIAVYCILFPFGGWKWMVFDYISPFDIWTQTWTIHGVKYSDEFFRQVAFADGRLLRLTHNEAGTVTFTQYAPGSTVLPPGNQP